MFRKTSKFHTLPVKELVKGTPYKEGDLVFAKNKKAKVYWPAKVIEVRHKSCRIQFFATNEVEKVPVKKIFPYEENKQRVKNHEAESLFYQAWRDIKVEAQEGEASREAPNKKKWQENSEVRVSREVPKVKKKRENRRRDKSPDTNWETTTFCKSDSDSSSEVVQRRKVKKKKCVKRKEKDEDSSESNCSAIVHFTRDSSEMDKPCVSGYEEKRNYDEEREKCHRKAGNREKRGKERSGKKKAGSSSRKCHHGKSGKKRHH